MCSYIPYKKNILSITAINRDSDFTTIVQPYLQGAPTSSQVPSAATCQTIKSSSAGMPAQQFIGGQQTQVVQEVSTLAGMLSFLSTLEESSENDLLLQSELTQLFMKSCSRKNMAVLMTRQLFSAEVLKCFWA